MMCIPRLAGLTLLFLPVAFGAEAACRVDVRQVSFGEIDVGRANHGRGQIVVTCDEPAKVKIGIVGGSDRRLRSGRGSDLRYRLYADAAYAQPWGDGSGGGQTVTAQNDGRKATRLTIYAVIPKQGAVAEGQYLDQLQVTLGY